MPTCFEHADRDDAVELLVDGTIVHQLEGDRVFQALGDGAIPCLGQLLAGQCDAVTRAP